MDKPLVKATVLFILGIVLGAHLPGLRENASDLLGMGLLLFAIAFLLRQNYPGRGSRHFFFLFLGITLIGSGLFRYSLGPALFRNHIARFRSDRPVEVTGTIYSNPVFKRHSARFVLKCHKLSRPGREINITGLLLVNFHGAVSDVEPIAEYGNIVRIKGKVTIPREKGNPGESSEREKLAAAGIHAETRIYKKRDLNLVEKRRGRALIHLTLDIKHRVQRIIRDSLPDVTGQPISLQSVLLEALILGNREQIPHRIKDNFRKAGVIHILVVSGLHVGFIWFLGNLLFSPLSLRWRHACVIPLVATYVLITGARNPTVRAGLMAAVFSLAFILNQPRNMWTAVAVAALCLLLFNPQNLFQPGFQLSFLIVAAIIALTPVLSDCFPFLPLPARPWLAVPIAAQLGAIPLIAHYFHFISPLALPANILVIPLVGVIVCLGFIAILSGFIFPPLALILNFPNRSLIILLLKLVGLLSRLPGAGVRINYFPASWVFLSYILLLGLSRWRYFRVRWKLGVAGLAIILMAGAGSAYFPRGKPELSAFFFNGESGNFTFLQTAEGHTVLIASDDDPFGEIPAIIEPFLFSRGIRRINTLILTQANPDHLNTLRKLLETVRVDSVLDHPAGAASPSYPAFLKLVGEEAIRLQTVSAGESLALGPLRCTFLWPEKVGGRFNPDLSLVFRLDLGRISLLFPSRIGVRAQKEILRLHPDLQSTILKVPGRGSRVHNLPAFLQAVNPRYALLIQGQKYFGRYPADCARELRQLGAEVYKSSEAGCIIVETDGEKCTARSFRPEEKFP